MDANQSFIKYTISIIVYFFINNFVFAQTPLDNIYPQSPEAAGMYKITEQSINAFDGTSGLSISLQGFKEGNLTVPIALTYNSAGNIVNNVPSWVGLGWTLQAGGVITRQVNHVPDEGSANGSGYWDSYNKIKLDELISIVGTQPTYANKSALGLYEKFANGIYDGQPDIFTISLPNIKAKFSYNSSSKLFIECDKDIKVDKIYDTGKICGFIVKDIDGTTYTFGAKNYKEVIDGIALEKSSDNTPKCWFLKEIVSNDGIDKISFNYGDKVSSTLTQNESIEYTYKLSGNPSFTFSNLNGMTPSKTLGHNIQSSISWSGGKSRLIEIKGERSGRTVNFTSIKNRRDGDNYISNKSPAKIYNEYYLDEIGFYSSQNQLYKKYKLSYNYNGGDVLVTNHDDIPFSYNNRLFLKKIEDISSSKKTRSHTFNYANTNVIPSYLSKSVDYWGYYNGKSNSTLVRYPEGLEGSGYAFDRYADERKMMWGILDEVIYPTGGKVNYTYEANKTTKEIAEVAKDKRIKSEYTYLPNMCFDLDTDDYCKAAEVNIRPKTKTSIKLYINLLGAKNYETLREFQRLKPKIEIFINNKSIEKTSLDILKKSSIHEPGEDPLKNHLLLKEYYLSNANDVLKYKLSFEEKYDKDFQGLIGILVTSIYTKKQVTPGGVTTYILGGLRVSQIQYKDINNTIVKQKRFEYPEPIINYRYSFESSHKWIETYQGSSSGSVNPPLYNLEWDFYKAISSSHSNVYGNSLLGYSWVKEIEEENGYTITSVVNKSYSSKSMNHDGIYWDYGEFPYPTLFTANPDNGKPLSSSIYSNDDELLFKTSNKYVTVEQGSLPAITIRQKIFLGSVLYLEGSMLLNNLYPNTKENWVYKITQQKSSTSKKLNNGIYFETKVENSYYENTHLLSSKSQYLNDDILKDTYFYFNDPLSNVSSTIKKKLEKKNDIQTPIYTITEKTGKPINFKKITLDIDKKTNYPFVQKLEVRNPINSDWIQLYLNHEEGGRLFSKLGKDGIYTTVIWDELLIHPIFILKGSLIKMNEFNGGLSLGSIKEGLANWNKLSVKFPDHQVLGYVYNDKDLLSQEIDHNGQQLFYYYNGYNELQYIKNNKGEYISSFNNYYSTEL